MCVLTRLHYQATINPDVIGTRQTLPLSEEADVDPHNMLPSTSEGVAPQFQDLVCLAWSELPQLLTLC